MKDRVGVKDGRRSGRKGESECDSVAVGWRRMKQPKYTRNSPHHPRPRRHHHFACRQPQWRSRDIATQYLRPVPTHSSSRVRSSMAEPTSWRGARAGILPRPVCPAHQRRSPCASSRVPSARGIRVAPQAQQSSQLRAPEATSSPTLCRPTVYLFSRSADCWAWATSV